MGGQMPSPLPADLVSSEDVAAMALAAGGQKPSCFNPLFRAHWAGKSDIRHIASRPLTQLGLRRCPAYNARPACCLNAFEHVLSRVFQRWVTHWKRKSQYIQDFQTQLAKVQLSQAYAKADKLERMLYDKAVASYAPVLKWHGTCFDTLLEYMAGMLCFACDPNWGTMVFLGDGGRTVEHLHVDDYSNEELWQSCRMLGTAASEMQTRVADSLLVKGIWSRFEDLSMFRSKISVSQYMSHLGLFAMRGPSENHLVLSPGPAASRIAKEARLLASMSNRDGPTGFINPVLSGRASGFQCAVFPRIPFGLFSSSSCGTKVIPALLLLIVAMLQSWSSLLRSV